MQEALLLCANTPPVIRTRFLLYHLHTLNNLKEIRQGWKSHKIKEGDTTLEHTEKVFWATSIFASNHPEYNFYILQDKAIVHNWPEEIGGGKMEGNIETTIKLLLEKIYMKEVCKPLPYSIAHYAYHLWEDFEMKRNAEDELLYQFDKICPCIHALDLEQNPYYYRGVQEFYPNTRSKLKHPTLIKIFDYMMEREFPQIAAFPQYISLLKLDGDIDKFRKHAKDALTPTKTQQILFN